MPAFWIVIALSVLSVAAFFWRADRVYRTPMAVFLGSYLVTTVIGATIIGWTDTFIWRMIYDPTLDVRYLRDTNSALYWFLLYSPFIIVPGMLAIVGRRCRPGQILRRGIALFETGVDRLSFVVTLAVFTGFCVFTLVRGGYGANLLRGAAMSGDFISLVRLRTQMFSALGGPFYSIIYISIPTLCNVAVFQYLRDKSRSWLLLAAAAGLADVVLVLSTIQKGGVFVLIVGVVLGYITLRRVRLRVIVPIAVGALVLLMGLQSILQGQVSMYQSILLVIFRMGTCYPFYVNVYPNLEPFQGMDYFLRVLGFNAGTNDSVVIFNYMYPQTFWIQGNASAAAQVRAYSQGGILSAVAALIIIGFAIVVIGRLRKMISGPMSFSLYVQSLIFLYYVTQTNIGEALKGYGILYAMIALAALWLCRQVLKLATASAGAVPRLEVPGRQGSTS